MTATAARCPAGAPRAPRELVSPTPPTLKPLGHPPPPRKASRVTVSALQSPRPSSSFSGDPHRGPDGSALARRAGGARPPGSHRASHPRRVPPGRRLYLGLAARPQPAPAPRRPSGKPGTRGPGVPASPPRATRGRSEGGESGARWPRPSPAAAPRAQTKARFGQKGPRPQELTRETCWGSSRHDDSRGAPQRSPAGSGSLAKRQQATSPGRTSWTALHLLPRVSRSHCC